MDSHEGGEWALIAKVHFDHGSADSVMLDVLTRAREDDAAPMKGAGLPFRGGQNNPIATYGTTPTEQVTWRARAKSRRGSRYVDAERLG